MIINVTQEHIDKGKRSSCKNCAVALAFKGAGFSFAQVDGTSVYLLGTETSRWDLPKEVCTFIRKFDHDLPVSPFSFEMEFRA